MVEKNIYNLSRKWFDFAYENPELIKPNHTAVYFFTIEHCNRLGWKDKFGLPSTMSMEAIGIKSYNTYINALNDLVDWGFIKMIEKSKNQYSANIVALLDFNKALAKALDKALIKHGAKHTIKQHESISESIDSVDKQVYNKQINQDTNLQIHKGGVPENYELSKKIISDFGFNEITNFDKLQQAKIFLNFIQSEGKLEYFTVQYKSYFEYKKISGEKIHNLHSFLGSPDKQFTNGNWDSANWTEKLNQFKNGKSKSSNSEDRKQSVARLAQSADDYIQSRLSQNSTASH